MPIENWGLLPKSQVDSETIEEAIARLITAHNDDETAHLDVGQSLQSHASSEIIDHLADSVLNDKLQLQSRAYTAIVSKTGTDFSDIQEAIDYVFDQGGGNVLIAVGTYILSENLCLRTGVSLEGFADDLSIINCNGFQIITSAYDEEGNPYWDDDASNIDVRYIGIKNGASNMVLGYGSLNFYKCRFYDGSGSLVLDYGGGNVFDSCIFSFTLTFFNAHASSSIYGIGDGEGVSSKIINCKFYNCPIAMYCGESNVIVNNQIDRCTIGIKLGYPGSTINSNDINNALGYGIYVDNSTQTVVQGNMVNGDERAGYYSSGHGIYLNNGDYAVANGNRVSHFQYGIYLVSTSVDCVIVGNLLIGNVSGGVYGNTTNNTIANNR
ncbi:MAG: right-handed parallel beta-helix repeat-containing protein [archaeon]